MAELTLERRLLAVGEALSFPRTETLVDDVLGAIDQPVVTRHRWRRPLLAVAAALLLVLATLAVPSSRRAVARWLGFDNYRIERVVDLPEIDTASPLPAGPLVMVLRGRIDEGTLGKIASGGSDVRVVSVEGATGYWISGDPHYFALGRRLAGNTLVWQRGDEIVRIEGTELTLTEALEIAEGIEEP